MGVQGRKTEAGRLPAKYQLKEMPTDSYQERTEQNVIDSDGTLIISHGELTGGSDYTGRMAEKHGNPWIHIDASSTSVEAAVELVRAWINGSQVKVLNVEGPRGSKDPKIYVTAVDHQKASDGFDQDDVVGQPGKVVATE